MKIYIYYFNDVFYLFYFYVIYTISYRLDKLNLYNFILDKHSYFGDVIIIPGYNTKYVITLKVIWKLITQMKNHIVLKSQKT